MHNDEPAPKKEDVNDDDVEINMDEANTEQDTIDENDDDDDDEEDFDDAGEVKLIPVGVLIYFIFTDLFYFSLPIVEQAAGRPQLRAGQARAEERLDTQRAQGDPKDESRG